MPIRYHSCCIFVADMERSRAFYEGLLGQEPTLVLDGYVAYPAFCLWRADTARRHVFDETASTLPPGPMGRDNLELYFEADPIENAWDRLLPTADLIHAMKAQPWGQRCFRLRDPDGHIIELAEPMETVVRRLHAAGKTEAEIVQATMMPQAFVRRALDA